METKIRLKVYKLGLDWVLFDVTDVKLPPECRIRPKVSSFNAPAGMWETCLYCDH